MYFNDEKNNTNIDKELSGNTISTFFKKYLKKFIIAFIVILVLILLLILLLNLFKKRVNFHLIGDTKIKVYQGVEYIDPGYIATDKNGVDVSNEVIVNNNVNTEVVGTYSVIYSIRGKKLARIVNVIPNNSQITSIFLKGDSIVYISRGSEYKESGYICVDGLDGDITDKVEVINNILNDIPGTYKILYKVVNSKGVTTVVSRVVVVK